MHDAQVIAVQGSVAVSEAERYWLAGLLEGEGTFLAGPPSQPSAPVIAVVMTDRDVVERVGRMWQRSVATIRPRRPEHKVAYATRIRGAAAAAWMTGLRPLLGERRQHQVDRALKGQRRRLRWLRPSGPCSVAACQRPNGTRGLCVHHYKLWWKATKRGRVSRYVATDAPQPLEPPASVAPSSATDPLWIGWLAGLLEGEGTFTTNRTYPVISTQMCDLDVMRRAAGMMAVPRVAEKDVERNRARGWSPAFYFAVTGARARDWMSSLRPLMGERRTAEIDRALGAYAPVRLTRAPATCVVSGCAGSHRGRGLCHRHYMKWDRDRKAGKPARITPLR